MSPLLAPQPIHPPPQHAPAPLLRLRSPISLPQKPQPSPSCSPMRRRPTGTPRRRRPHPRAERAIHAFDQLPWISALEAPPGLANPWDIADLSLLPDPAEGLGPVRRRKTSLRSNPMGSSPDSSPDSSPLTPPTPGSPPLTATPLSRFSPSRILFRNLMPVSLCDDGSPHRCINIRPLDF